MLVFEMEFCERFLIMRLWLLFLVKSRGIVRKVVSRIRMLKVFFIVLVLGEVDVFVER